MLRGALLLRAAPRRTLARAPRRWASNGRAVEEEKARAAVAAAAAADAAKGEAVRKAIETAAAQNAPLFGFSHLTLRSPLLWVGVAATIAIGLAAEAYQTKTPTAQELEEDEETARRRGVRDGLENYRVKRKRQAERDAAAPPPSARA